MYKVIIHMTDISYIEPCEAKDLNEAIENLIKCLQYLEAYNAKIVKTEIVKRDLKEVMQ